MAITNAQQYKQLVNPPLDGKRPGYRGPGEYQGGKSSSSKSSSSKSSSKSSNTNTGGGGGGNTNREQYITDYSSKQKVKGGGLKKIIDSDDGGVEYGYSDLDFRDPKNKEIIDRQRRNYQDQFTSKGLVPPGPNRKARQRALNYINKNMIADYNRFGKYYDPNKFGVTKTGYPNFGFPNFYEGIMSAINAGATLDEILENENMIPLGSGPSYEFDKIREEFNKADADRKVELLEQVGLKGLEDLKGTSYEMNPIPDLDIDSIRELAATQTTMQGAPLTGYQAGALKELREGINKRDNFLETGDTSGIFPDPNTPNPDDDPEDPCLGPNPPAYCFLPKEDPEPETPKVDPTAFRFLADGGRAGFAEGGIMPRLNQLSGNVSSAEQMLQEINQRLESAESSLGGGDPANGLMAIQPNNFQPTQMPIGQPQPGSANQLPGLASIENFKPFEGKTFNEVPEQFRSGFDEYMKDKPLQMGGQAISYVGLPGGNRVMFSDTGSAGTFRNYLNSIGQGVSPIGTATAIQSPIAGAMRQGAMDGGIMNADIVGGMMDGNMDEMGRQMYGLGKLVKKVTRGIKKVVKSPLGKAALIGGLGFLGMKNPAISGFFKNKVMPFMFEGGKFDLAKLTGKGGLAAIGALSALPLLFGQEEEDDFDPYRGPDIDIDAIRGDPYGAMGGAYRLAADGGLMRAGYQEGGDAEPVAKKTMPLIDMDGKEKDYRETGGFVDMGRMERADDVPARLSKNEFVFTADAVRNAGDGDVDKGAEVMYNMMKNLEAGGEVSEESQGLEGARNMFQTSQRLEEVL